MKNRILILSCVFLSFFSYSQCTGSEPIVFLGNDTTLCAGQSLTLQAPTGYDLYSWSDNSTNTSFIVSQPGTYNLSVTITSGGNNLVVNGDFENGNSGFTSSYGYVATAGSTALWNPGYYAVGTSPQAYHSNFYACTDHTSGTGKMYIANGASSANTVIWSETITVIPNTNYNFSAWVTSVENTSVPAILQFFVNGIQIGNVFSPTTTGCDWGQFFNVWNSSSNTSAVITIKNQNIDGAGNDFAIDDISFRPYCTNTDEIIVTYDTTNLAAGPDLSFCEYTPSIISAISNDASLPLTWNTGEAANFIIPDSSGMYIVSTTSDAGCELSDTVNTIIFSAPEAIMVANPATGIVPLSVFFSNTSQNADNFIWTFGNGESVNTTDLSSVSTIYSEPGFFSVEMIASNANCVDTASLTIIVTNPVSLETANVFTPNNDGLNDVFKFKMVNVIELELSIFNRWGQLIHTVNNVTDTWNGMFDGKEASDGIYFYTYTAKGLQEINFEGQGFIHLIR